MLMNLKVCEKIGNTLLWFWIGYFFGSSLWPVFRVLLVSLFRLHLGMIRLSRLMFKDLTLPELMLPIFPSYLSLSSDSFKCSIKAIFVALFEHFGNEFEAQKFALLIVSMCKFVSIDILF